MKVIIMEIAFNGVGWKSKVSKKRATFGITINKIIAVGSSLEKGKELYCYLVEDSNKRKAALVYLDGADAKNRNV